MKLAAFLCLAVLSVGAISVEEKSPLIKSLSSGPSVEDSSATDISAPEDRSKRHLLKAKVGLLGLGLLGGGIVGAKLGVLAGGLGGLSGGWSGRSGGWGGGYHEGGGYYGGSGGYSQSYAPSYPTRSNVVHHHYHETAPQVQVQPQPVYHHHEHRHVEQPNYQTQQVVHHQHHHVQEPQYHVQQPEYHNVAQNHYLPPPPVYKPVEQPQLFQQQTQSIQFQQPPKVWSPPVDNCVQGW